jgi:hypothetical protein
MEVRLHHKQAQGSMPDGMARTMGDSERRCSEEGTGIPTTCTRYVDALAGTDRGYRFLETLPAQPHITEDTMIKIGNTFIVFELAQQIDFVASTSVVVMWKNGGLSHLKGSTDEIAVLRSIAELHQAMTEQSVRNHREQGPYWFDWDRARDEIEIETWKRDERRKRNLL